MKTIKKISVLLAAAMAFCAVFCACSSGSSESRKTLSEVWNQVTAEVTFEDFNTFDAPKKLQRYYGITEDMMTEYAGGVNGSGVNQEEIVLVKAKDEDSAKEIKEKLDARFESKLSQNKNYNAEQAKMIEGCRVEQNGLYVSMIVSNNAETITGIYKEALGL